MPSWTFICSLVLRSLVLVAFTVLALGLVARLAYGVEFRAGSVGGLVVYILLGTFTFCCLGAALTTFTRSTEAASALRPVQRRHPLVHLRVFSSPSSSSPSGSPTSGVCSRSSISPRDSRLRSLRRRTDGPVGREPRRPRCLGRRRPDPRGPYVQVGASARTRVDSARRTISRWPQSRARSACLPRQANRRCGRIGVEARPVCRPSPRSGRARHRNVIARVELGELLIPALDCRCDPFVLDDVRLHALRVERRLLLEDRSADRGHPEDSAARSRWPFPEAATSARWKSRLAANASASDSLARSSSIALHILASSASGRLPAARRAAPGSSTSLAS